MKASTRFNAVGVLDAFRAPKLMLALRRALSSSGAMTGRGARDERSRSDQGFVSTLDASQPDPSSKPGPSSEPVSREETITPDPFLDQVARVPRRSLPNASDGALPESMPSPGETLGRFTILSEIGRGGMGVVYAAEDRALGREVALKVLPTSGDERRRRFLREARAAAGLTHPGIATIYDVGEADGRVFIAMELVHGATLRSVLEARPSEDPALPIDEVRRIAREVAQALAKAHGRGVIHRDLKPENVMIDGSDEGRVKLLDFGLAKNCASPLAIASGPLTTEEGRVLGTPSYMSPEQAKGRYVDARSDVFSLGVMLYELATGVRPFPGITAIEVFIALDRDEPEPPSRKNPRVDAGLEAVIVRCLQKDPERRYPNARALLVDLTGGLGTISGDASHRPQSSSGAVVVEPPRTSSRGPSRGPSRGLAWQVSASGVAVLCLAGLWATRGAIAPNLTGPTPVTMTALPAPKSTNVAAVAAYKRGLVAFRAGGDWDSSFGEALGLEPDLAEAHVQLAALGMFGAHAAARTHFRRAEELVAKLDERDRALLHAVEPVVRRQPSDWAEAKRRLAALVEKYPGDAQLWYLLAVGAANFDDFEDSVCKLETALAIDPGFTRAWAYMAEDFAYMGRFDDAHVVIDRCLQQSPTADVCLAWQANLQENEGACEAMEGTARQFITSSGQPLHGYAMLASALAAQGKPVATIREILKQAAARIAKMPAAEAEEARSMMDLTEAYIAIFAGDFEAAEKHARAELADAATKTTQAAHGLPAALLASILDETGRAAEAGAVALDFLNKRDAWEPEASAEDMALSHDATPALLRIALRGGSLTPSELGARRDPWLRTWTAKVTPVSRNFLWMYAYASVVDAPEDARAALDALPAYGALPPFRPETLVGVDVGRTYLLAGRVDDALPWLTHAAKTCSVLSFPFAHAQAELLLGQAREAQGEKAKACGLYNGLVQHWGTAKPRSVTAEKAASRAATLGCAT